MLKTIVSIVLATIISSILLSVIGFAPSFEIKDDDDETKVTTVAADIPADNTPPGAPGCDEDLSGSVEVTTSAHTTSTPQIDYGWPEEPGPS